jgi:L-threonylcarbamoyladenylate synthase
MGTRRRRVSVIYFISKLVKWDDLRMEIISNPTQEEIKKAAQSLKEGHLVAFPTETVYGLGADATNENAVSRVYSVKGRPKDHPLIVHISSAKQLIKWALDIPDYAAKLANEFWPGPMTLILKKSELAKEFITGGQESVGLRIPDQQIALKLLEEFEGLGGFGIAAPSANRFGSISPTTASAVEIELSSFLGSEDFILDGGQCTIGVESSIIDCTKSTPVVLRPGAVSVEMIESITGFKSPLNSINSDVKTSGLLESHYAPKAQVSLGMRTEPGDGFLAFADIPTPIGTVRLASPKSNEEFAQVLYSALRLGDQFGLKHIVVVEPKGEGLALAIRDRLNKAASGKTSRH